MIYTIGHGKRTFEGLKLALVKYNVKTLVDVRSVPYSRYQSDFNKEKLEENFGLVNEYIPMGNKLGGRPTEEECYDLTGKIDYGKLRQNLQFRKGIDILKRFEEMDISVCLMCSESDPLKCHRSKCIGVDLLELGIDVSHILQNDEIVKQSVLSSTKFSGGF